MAGRLGLVPPGVTDPPASARVGVSCQWAATLREVVQKMEGRDIGVEPVAPDVLPPGLHLDYDPDSETRGVDDIAPVLTPSLLSGLVGNIHGLKKPEVPTQPIPFEAGVGMVACEWIPPKTEALGPSHEAGIIPPTPVSQGEVSKCEPFSQQNSPVFEVDPEKVVEVIVPDDDDLDLILEVPPAISTPANEPAPHRKQGADDQDPPLPPSRKRATKEEGMSTPYQEEALPKEVRLEDILPKRYCKMLFANYARLFLPVFLFLILSCPKHALVWGNCCERLHVEIFVKVLHSSRVNFNNVNNTNVFSCV